MPCSTVYVTIRCVRSVGLPAGGTATDHGMAPNDSPLAASRPFGRADELVDVVR